MTRLPTATLSPPRWTVLLIGGSSGTGKTTLAEAIGRTVGVPWLQADDVRLALQRITRPSQQPALHAFLAESVWQRPSEELRDRFIAVGEIVSHALQIVVANHVATDAPLILEGDGILPALAARTTYAGLDVGDRVRAVFLTEPDERVILDAMQVRGRGIDAFTTEERIVPGPNQLAVREVAPRGGRPLGLARCTGPTVVDTRRPRPPDDRASRA